MERDGNDNYTLISVQSSQRGLCVSEVLSLLRECSISNSEFVKWFIDQSLKAMLFFGCLQFQNIQVFVNNNMN